MASLLLAIDLNRQVLKIPVEKNALAELNQKFARLTNDYVADREMVPYEPGYTPPVDEVLVTAYDLPPVLQQIRTAVPSGLPILDPSTLVSNPPVALVHVKLGPSPTFCFQTVTKENLLLPRRALLFGNKHFEFNQEVGLLPTNRLDAIHEGGQLVFRSELRVRRFLDMEAFFTEASDQVLEEFFEAQHFVVDDIAKVKTAATQLLRRKIAKLASESAVLDIRRVKSAAQEAGVDVKFKGKMLVVPGDRKGLKNVVDLLSHAYVQSLVDPSRKYYASSLRPISKSN